jgi:hypothetical protein
MVVSVETGGAVVVISAVVPTESVGVVVSVVIGPAARVVVGLESSGCETR